MCSLLLMCIRISLAVLHDKKCILHENRLFRKSALVNILAEARLEAEKLGEGDLEAAKLELRYTISQLGKGSTEIIFERQASI